MILKWKDDQKHLGKEQVLQNKNSNDVSKRCVQWDIANNFYYHPWQHYTTALKVCFDKYFKRFPSSRLMHGRLELETYNLQHYRPSEGFYLTVPCEKGVTLVWPAPWTHTHRGQISLTHEKTIVTGWLRLKDAKN